MPQKQKKANWYYDKIMQLSGQHTCRDIPDKGIWQRYESVDSNQQGRGKQMHRLWKW